MIRIKPFKIYFLIASLFCAIGTSYIDVNGLHYLFLLPLIYGLCINFLLPNHLRLNAGLLILLLVLTFRYLLYPILLAIEYEPIFRVGDYGNEAIFFMVTEMLVIFTTVSLFYRRKTITFDALSKSRINPFLVVILVLISLMFTLMGNSFMTGKHFIWETDSIMADTQKLNGVASQLFNWCEAFVLLFFINKYSQMYELTKKNFFFIISIFFCFIPCLFYSGHSRLSLLIPLVCSCAMAYKVFREKAWISIFFCLFIGIIVLTLLSIVKNLDSTDSSAGASDLFSHQLLNAYFGGVDNIITGLRTYENYGTNSLWFIWDSLRNAMGISKNFTSFPGSNIAFNNVFYGKIGVAYDQIVPTIISGMIYFGKVFFFIPTIIMTYIVCKFDMLFSRSKTIAESYLYSNFPVIIAWAIPGSWMHLTTRFFNFFIPILLLIYLNSYLNRRKS